MCGTGPFAAEPSLADTARAAATTAATRSFAGLAGARPTLDLFKPSLLFWSGYSSSSLLLLVFLLCLTDGGTSTGTLS